MPPAETLDALSAAEAVAAMRRGEITAEAYASALLARAEAWRHLNAFLALEPDRVLEHARAADSARARGGALGLLHGLPIPIKDSVDTRELPTTQGTAALRGHRPRVDAEVVKRLQAAGAYVMGKTNLHELSRGWTSNNLAYGAVGNPYDPARVPGGSSGGSAAAVGARIAPLALAEDTWGSIRVPAAWCGVAGLRPTVARYPNDGVMSLTTGHFDQVGPVARRVEDLALFDRAVTGDHEPIVPARLDGVRLGLPVQFLVDLAPDVERVVSAACDRLRAAGVTLVEARLPDVLAACPDIAGTVIQFESAATIQAYLDGSGTGLTFEALLAAASPGLRSRYDTAPTREEYQQAMREREAARRAIDSHFAGERIEALVFPPLLATAPIRGDNSEVPVGDAMVPIRRVVGRNTALGNVTRLSSLVLRAGVGGNGMPVGLELDAPTGADRRLLALGLAVEQVLNG